MTIKPKPPIIETNSIPPPKKKRGRKRTKKRYFTEDTDLAIRIWDLFPNSFYYTSQIAAEHYHKRTLKQFCTQMEIYGKYNLPILLERHPRYHKELGGNWVKSLKGYLIFNTFIATIINFLNTIVSFHIFTKYLVIYSTMCGYRKA